MLEFVSFLYFQLRFFFFILIDVTEHKVMCVCSVDSDMNPFTLHRKSFKLNFEHSMHIKSANISGKLTWGRKIPCLTYFMQIMIIFSSFCSLHSLSGKRMDKDKTTENHLNLGCRFYFRCLKPKNEEKKHTEENEFRFSGRKRFENVHHFHFVIQHIVPIQCRSHGKADWNCMNSICRWKQNWFG